MELSDSASVCFRPLIHVHNISSASHTNCSLAGCNSCVLTRPFPHLLQALKACGFYWRHMVTLTLIANISRTSLELQLAFFFFFFFTNADSQSSWSEVWWPFLVCGFVCLDLCLDVNVGKKKKTQLAHTQHASALCFCL